VQCFINPLENIQKIVTDHIQNESWPMNRGKIIKTMQSTRKGIFMDTFEDLISIMPHVMNAPINANGGNTK